VRADFPRFLDDGRGVDVGRVLGSFQDFQTEEHAHPTDGTEGGSRHVIDMNTDGIIDAYSTRSSGDDGGYLTGSNTGRFGGSETRGRNTAFAGFIKY
ncbi:hypothetical protein TW85_25250, partial [Marinomonas sp. S3726]|uniref:hypothetical protein n=1 Tax=Marinomonas sp. S3726 TaxID=579484 RepID=UPI0005FA6796